MKKLFAGLDVSTQSCKLVVLDIESGKVVFVNIVNYDEDLPLYDTRNGVIKDMPEGVSESDPHMWIEAVNSVLKKFSESSVPIDAVRCISVSGQQHGLVALDKDGNLARATSKLWNDFSTQEECEILTALVGGPEVMIKETGNSQRTGYTAAKIFHLVRHEPKAYRKASTLFLVHNYINWYLTGGVRIMEPGDTSGTALWNPKSGKWSKKVINAIDENLINKLPEVKPSYQTIGTISDKLVSDFGFSPDCFVDAGCGDNMYSAVGTGNVKLGIVTISLGTSGTAYSYMDEPYVDPYGEIASFCDSTGHYLPLLCVSNLANGYNSILEEYKMNHKDFNHIINKTDPGNKGRIIIPWYEGERTPDIPHAAAIYFGFWLHDFTPEILSRAVLEGHILNLYDGFQRLPVKVKEIRLTGGLSQSEVWCQTIADVFNAETVPVKGEGAALGAALHAAWVWLNENGSKIDLKGVIQPFIEFDESMRKRPIKKNVSVYRKQIELFQSVSQRIRGLKGKDPFEIRASLNKNIF